MRAEVLGLPIDCLTRDQTVEELRRRLESRHVTQHVVLNASKVLQCHDDPALAEVVRRCGLINADGMSVVWAGRLLGVPIPERVTGIDLMHDLWGLAAERGFRVFMLGAREHVLARTVQLARDQGIVVCGSHSGYWKEDRDVVDEVRRSRADILFLAIPSPRKEFFLQEWLDEMGVTLGVGVGGSFDVIAGETKRAPIWMQRLGLEWLVRMAQEPRRLGRRYIVGNIRFAALTLTYARSRTR